MPAFALTQRTLSTSVDSVPEVAQRLEISVARWDAFHTKAKILIIDDELSTAKRVGEGLQQLYAEVEFCCNPKEAIDLIRQAKNRGQPYSCVVCDIYMRELQGTELLKSLGEDAPPTVVHSHTMPAPVWASISSQIAEFTGRNAQAIFAEHASTCKASAVPAVPLLFQHKFENAWLKKLVDKIDYVQLINQQDSSQLPKFIESYLPSIVSLDLPKELLHKFSEKIRNFGLQIHTIFKYLEDECSFKSIDSWNKVSEGLFLDAQKCSQLSFDDLSSSIPSQNRSSLHSALQWISNIDPDNIEITLPTSLSQNEVIQEKLAVWKNIHSTCNRELNKIFQDFQLFYREDFELNSFIKSTFSKLAIPGSFFSLSGGSHVINDPDRQVRTFLCKLADSLLKRRDANDNDSSYFCCDSIDRRNIISHSEKGVSAALIKRGFDTCLEISYSDNQQKDFESDPNLSDLWPELSSLVMQTDPLIYSTTSQFTNGEYRLLLFIKTSSIKAGVSESAEIKDPLLHSELIKNLQGAKQSYFQKKQDSENNISVIEVELEKYKVSCLEEFLFDSDRKEASSMERRAVIILGQDGVLISSSYGNGHLAATMNVVRYIDYCDRQKGYRGKQEDDLRYRGMALYRNAIRVLQPADSNQFILAMEADDPDLVEVKELLIELGIKAEYIIADKSKFDFSPN